MALAVRAFLQPEELPLKDFFDTWKFKILVAVAVFLVGIMAYAGANGRLTAAPQELLALAEKILSGEVPPFCPHGRPCVLKLTRKELEKQFGRIV